MGELSDALRNRGVMPREGRRFVPWQQVVDWFTPGNVYRYNEGTGWSRPDLIGAGVQMGTGLPVAGFLSRLISGESRRQSGRHARESESDRRSTAGFEREIRSISNAAANHLRMPDFSGSNQRISDDAAAHIAANTPEIDPSRLPPSTPRGAAPYDRRAAGRNRALLALANRIDGFNERADAFMAAMHRPSAK